MLSQNSFSKFLTQQKANRKKGQRPDLLTSSIASGMIYEIIQGLTDIQQGTEKHLFHQRLEMLKKQSDEKVEFKARYRETLAKIASSTNGEDQDANNKEGGPGVYSINTFFSELSLCNFVELWFF